MNRAMKQKLKLFSFFATFLVFMVFLFGLPRQNAVSANDLPVVFALTPDADQAALMRDYDLDGLTAVFGENPVLPKTFRIKLSERQLAELRKDARVSYATLDKKIQAAAVSTSDPFFTVDQTAEDLQWYLAKIQLPEAWQYGKGSQNVIVAVIDTGIHASHIELNDGRVIAGYDTTQKKDIFANSNSDENGHGTAVAGVIGAIANNSRGIAGINWNVKLMPLKALNSDGTGEISSVAAAIVWAADHGAQIINLSLGGPGFGADQTLNNAIKYAFEKNVLIVAAAGNDLAEQGINLDTTPVFPICSDLGSNMVLGVAASDINDRKAEFSNFSINCVDLTAPGKKILTTAFLPSEPANNILIYGSGTSLATPIVSGIAALLKANNPNLSNTGLRDILLAAADKIDDLNQDNCLGSSCNGFLGRGRINALTALAPKPISEGSLIQEATTGKIYLITGGNKRFVSGFVFQQRGFKDSDVALETNNQLISFVEGPALPPLGGTLIKADNDPTVFVIHQEVKRPLTYLVFLSRNYSFANVHTLSSSEINNFVTGEWYWPPDGTMVLVENDPTVYVMDKEVRRPVTYFVFIQRKLSFAKVVKVTQDEFSHLPGPSDGFWLPPLDGTLVKSVQDPTVYLLVDGTRHGITYEAFLARKLSFKNVVILPQAELDVIAPGEPIIK